jgi:hypothetical protein
LIFFVFLVCLVSLICLATICHHFHSFYFGKTKKTTSFTKVSDYGCLAVWLLSASNASWLGGWAGCPGKAWLSVMQGWAAWEGLNGWSAAWLNG